MGDGRFDSKTWTDYSTVRSYATKTRSEIFDKKTIDKELDPKHIQIRESRDSEDNPNSTAIILAQDVTGSMGMISEALARKGIPTLAAEIYDRKPVTDPHIMCLAIGDVECDSYPLQATQFEADIRISEQLEKIYLEGGGGGNNYESYALAWYFAEQFTATDCFDKRNKKGYLFTIGDEEPTAKLTKNQVGPFLNVAPAEDIHIGTLLDTVSKRYELFHIVVEEGSYARYRKDEVKKAWNNVLGQRVIMLSDHTKLAEVIVSTIEVNEGSAVDDVVGSWDGSTSLVVKDAISGLTTVNKSSGLVTF